MKEEKVKIYRSDKYVVLPEKWWIREKKLKDPSFDPRWQVIDYDKYIKNIHKFHDACGPIDNQSYVKRKKESWEKKLDPRYIEAKAKKKLEEEEKIKKFILIHEEFTIDNGMLTPTLKLKRKEIIKNYKQQLENLY